VLQRGQGLKVSRPEKVAVGQGEVGQGGAMFSNLLQHIHGCHMTAVQAQKCQLMSNRYQEG